MVLAAPLLRSLSKPIMNTARRCGGHIEWQYLEAPAAGSVRVGERVSAAAGGLPIYRVMAIDGGRAWLREERDGVDRVLSIQHFHWKVHQET